MTWKIDFESPDFMIFDATVPSQCYIYQKNILQHLIVFLKMKLVSTVWVSTSLSKSGYYQGDFKNTLFEMLYTIYKAEKHFFLNPIICIVCIWSWLLRLGSNPDSHKSGAGF